MTTFESISVGMQAVMTLTLVLGLVYSIAQLRMIRCQMSLIRESHVREHKWHQKMAAQEALERDNLTRHHPGLDRALHHLTSTKALPLATIMEAIEKEPELRSSLHTLLNSHESFARGVLRDMYDEAVVKAARKGAMMNAHDSFKEYIVARRRDSPKALTTLETIVNSWRKDEEASRGV